MWLIANDVIIGGAVATFFCDNSEYIGHALGAVVQVRPALSRRLSEILIFRSAIYFDIAARGAALAE